MEPNQGDSIILEEEIDPNYEPTEDEVLEYAKWLGMDLEAERDLFWIAREGLKAPLPENWKPCKTTDTSEIYYFNFTTGASTWDHPCDEFYRNLYEEHKGKRSGKKMQSKTEEKQQKEKEDIAELLNKKPKKKKSSKKDALGSIKSNLDKKPLPGIGSPLASPVGLSALGTISSLKKSSDSLGLLTTKKTTGVRLSTNNLSISTANNCESRNKLIEDSEASVREVEDEFARQKKKIMAENQQILEDLEDEIKSKRKKMMNEWEKEKQKQENELDAAVIEYENKLAKKKRDCKRQIDEEDRKISEVLEEKEKSLEYKLERLQEEMDKKLSRMKKELQEDHESERDRLEKKAKEKMKNDLEDEMDILQKEQEQRLQKIKEKAQQEVAQEEEKLKIWKNEAIKEYHDAASSLEKALEELKNVQLQLAEEVKKNESLESALIFERENFNKLKASCKDMGDTQNMEEQSVLKRDIIALQEQLKNEQKKCSNLEHLNVKNAMLKQEVNDKNEQLEKIQLQVKSLEDEMEKLRKGDSKTNSNLLESTANNIVVVNEQNEEINTLKYEKNDLNEAICKYKERDAVMEEENNLLTESLKKSQAELSELQKGFNELLEKNNSMRSEIDASKNDERIAEGDIQSRKSCVILLKQKLKEAEDNLLIEISQKRMLAEDYDSKTVNMQNKLERMEKTLEIFKLDSYTDSSRKPLTEDLSSLVENLQSEIKSLEDKNFELTLQISQIQLDQKSSVDNCMEMSTPIQGDYKNIQQRNVALTEQSCVLQESQHVAEESLNEKIFSLKKKHEDTIISLNKKIAVLENENLEKSTQLSLMEVDVKQNSNAEQLNSQLFKKQQELDLVYAKDNDLEIQLNSLKSKLTTSNRNLEQCREEKSSLTHENDNLKLSIENLKKSALDVTSGKITEESYRQNFLIETKKFKDKMMALSTQLDVVKMEARSSSTDAENTKKQLAREKNQLMVLNEKYQNVVNEKNQIHQDNITKEDALLELQQKIKEHELVSDSLKSDLIYLQKQLDDSNLENTQLLSSKAELSGRDSNTANALLNSRIETLTLSKQQLQEKIRESQRENQELERKMRIVVLQKDQLDKKLSVCSSEIKSMSIQYSTLSDNYAKAQLDLENLAYEKEDTSLSNSQLNKDNEEQKLKILNITEEKENLELLLQEHSKLSIETEAQWEKERFIMANQIKKLENDCKRSKNEATHVQKRRDELEVSLKEKSEKCLKGESEIRSITIELNEAQLKLNYMKEDNQNQVNSLDTAQQCLIETREKLRTKEMDYDLLDKVLIEEKQKCSKLETNIDMKSSEYDILKKQFDELKSALSDSTDNMKEELQIYMKKYEDLKVENNKLNIEQNEYKSKTNQLNEELVCANEHLEAARLELKALGRRKEEIHDILGQSNNRYKLKHDGIGSALTGSNSLSTDVIQMKLQLHESTCNELESQLKEVVCKLERKCRELSISERLGRDQAIENELLKSTISALREATRTMHISALDSLPTIERLEYEKKKSDIRDNYSLQLRDFEKREEDSLMRQKARIRSSCERRIDELISMEEAKRKRRIEEESRESTRILQQIQRENQEKKEVIERNFKEQLKAMEAKLQNDQEAKFKVLSDSILQEEETLNSELRNIKQLSREKELLQNSNYENSPNDASKCNSPIATAAENVANNKIERCKGCSSKLPEARDSKKSKGCKKKRGTKKIANWISRIEQEWLLLKKAKSLLSRQKLTIRKQREKVLQDKAEWKNDYKEIQQNSGDGGYGGRILFEVKRIIDQTVSALNTNIQQLKDTESWIFKREEKVRKMEDVVERISNGSNNNKGEESDSSFDSGDESFDEKPHLDQSIYTLEKLNEELKSDISEIKSDFDFESENYGPLIDDPTIIPPPPPLDRIGYGPRLFNYPEYQSLRNTLPPESGYYRKGWCSPYPLAYPQPTFEKFDQNRDKYADPSQRNRLQIYQKQIAKWASSRAKAQKAAHHHANWLGELCSELKDYGNQSK